MKVDELRKEIENNSLKNVYLVLGEDTYLNNKVKELFWNYIPESDREFNAAIYDMETTSIATAIADAISAPFFSEKRLVIITHPYFLTGDTKKHSIEQDVNELIGYLQNPSPDTLLVVLASYDKLDSRKKVVKELKSKAEIVDTSSLNESEIRQYLIKYCDGKKVIIEKRAIDRLIQLTNANFSKIMNELSKLIIATVDTKKITVSEVDGLVTKSLEQNVFDLVDFVRDKKIKEAFELYHELLEQKEEPIKINAILIGQFRLLLQVKILQKYSYDQGSIASTLKVHPFRVKLAMQNARKFSNNSLKSAYLGLAEIEEKLKTSSQNPELLFQLFLTKYAYKK
ncbi:DNA polymerase III subunit delta [Ligilactobacillus salivarius]|uniref:DNA polymerase III subunit delta n=1 Tax=Ligilactobacillus salivarius TaxID=1624 RepID=UPI000BAF3053|nr:DNA polymerase III subunit delta [Ligilactobacillus salivarius]PAY53697.1 DNA polymerase III subunit delta [Ligilactobacillus salivarius]PAY63265.1 DNA polymerase III subunit delta [Ligilactobacillus salivarius]PAY65564.1 DNA polymerase III subunit delta [Ligilactobacillus salivarius]